MSVAIAKVILPAFAIVLLVGWAVAGSSPPLSLATDVGTSDPEVCAAIEATNPEGVRRLESTAFPHATSSPLEVYRLAALGETKAIVQVDWRNDRAQCLPLDYAGPASATIALSDGGYAALVGEIKRVMRAEAVDGGTVGNLLIIFFRSDVEVAEGNAFAYKLQLARWAGGWAVSGGA